MGSLEYEIQAIEENIAIKEKTGKDASFEKELLKEYKKYLPGGSKHKELEKASYSEKQ